MIKFKFRFIVHPFKIIVALFALMLPLHAYDESSESSDSDSDSIEINPFRQIPQPMVDVEMECLTNFMSGLSLGERDTSLYNKALNCHIQKCQEYHKILSEMLHITTFVCMFPYCYGRDSLSKQFSHYLKYLTYIASQKDEAFFVGDVAKRYILPGGEVHFLPSTNFISRSLIGAHIETNSDAALAKSILDSLVPTVHGCLAYLQSEREKFHRMMRQKMSSGY